MEFLGDDRGQSIQVGAVLLFAVLVLAFSTYQAFIVPEENKRVEFEHSQEVRSQLNELRTAIVSTKGGTARSTTIDLGFEYPPRAIALNPEPPAGTLRTVGTDDPQFNLTIRNATASGETGDLWDGDARHYNTGGMRYRTSYNRYRNAPRTGYEHTLLYDEFDADTVVAANQTFIQGERLSLITLNGSLRRSSGGSTSVDVRPITHAERTVLIDAQSANAPVTLNFTSRLSADRWRRIVGGRTNVESVSGSTSPAGDEYNSIQVKLATGVTYELEMTKSAVGTGATDERAVYLTDVSGDGGSVARGNNKEMTLEVRDGYNNPVAGVIVNGSVGSGGSLDSGQETTDDSGQVTFQYTTTNETATATHLVNFTTEDSAVLSGRPFADETPTNGTMSVTVTSASGGGGAYTLDWTNPGGESANSGDALSSCDSDACTWDVGASDDDQLTLNATLDPTYEDIDVEYALDNTTVGTLSATSGTTGSDGADQTTLTAEENGTVTVLASAKDDSDVIEIEIVGVASDPGPPGGLAYDDANRNDQYDSSETTYTRSELESGFDDNTVNLVVPSDVGTISSDSVSISANSLTADVDVESTDGALALTASGGDVTLTGQDLSASNGAASVTANGDLTIDDTVLESSTDQVSLDGGTVSMENADLTASSDAIGVTSNGVLEATGASMTSDVDDLDLVSSGDMRLNSTTIAAPNGDATADLNQGSSTLYVDGAVIDDADDTLEYSPNGADVVGTPSSGSVS